MNFDLGDFIRGIDFIRANKGITKATVVCTVMVVTV
jgi:hypothetical protein